MRNIVQLKDLSSEGLNYKKKSYARVSIVFFFLSLILILATLIFSFSGLRSVATIYLGIRGARSLLTGFLVTGGASLAAAFIFTAEAVSCAKKEQLAISSRIESQTKLEEDLHAPKLGTKNRIDEDTIEGMLHASIQGKWNCLSKNLKKIQEQLNDMDKLQASLLELIQNNGAQSLDDSIKAVDEAEQGMFLNLRSVLNHMSVRDPSRDDDIVFISAELNKCTEKNGQILEKTRDFNYALTDFLNGQGNTEGKIQMLDTYKHAVLDSIKEE